MLRCEQLILRSSLPLLLVLCAVAGTATAQSVQGRLVDVETGAPIEAAVVELLQGEAEDEVAARAETDEQGRFRLNAPSPGTYRLRSLRLGYEPVITHPFEITSTSDPLEVEFQVSALAVPLDPLIIESEPSPVRRSQRLANAGYYHRLDRYGPAGLGSGQFIDQEEIRSTFPSRVSDVLRTVRGVWVTGGGGRRQVVTMRARGFSADGRCVPQVYVDGVPAATGDSIDDLLSPWSLAAVEVYTGVNVPARFWRYPRGGGGSLCGVVVLWTGYGGADPGTRTSTPPTPPVPPDLELRLSLSADSVTDRDTLMAVVTVENLANEPRSFCLTESRYTLRRSSTSREVQEGGSADECVDVLELESRGWIAWRELVPLDAAVGPGVVLIQRVLRLRATECHDEPCETELRSAPLHVFVHHSDGVR